MVNKFKLNTDGLIGLSIRNDASTSNHKEIKSLVENITKAFNDFRELNDKRIKEIEGVSCEIPETRSAVDKANKEITDLKNSLDLLLSKVGRLEASGSSSDNNTIQVLSKAKSFFNSLPKDRKAAVSNNDQMVEIYQNYREGFSQWVRAGLNMDQLPPDIRAAMSVGSDRSGGYRAPSEISDEIETRLFNTSPMRSIARVINTGANAWEAPYRSGMGSSGGWVGERQARTSTETATHGMQRIDTKEQYALPEVTQTMLDDDSMDLEDYLIEETEEALTIAENSGFVSGNGILAPKGFLSYANDSVTTKDSLRAWGTLQYIPVGDDGAFPELGSGASNPDALITTVTSLNSNLRTGANWAMNNTTEAAVRKLKDSTGQYLINLGSIEGGINFNLFGYSIVNFEDMPDIGANSFSIAFGNFKKGYYIIDRKGFTLLLDPYTNKPNVGFYITKRVGGDVRNFDAIKLIKFSAS